jgi:hypothetical protein
MTRLGHSVPKINPCAAPAGRRRACGSVQLFGGIRTSAFAPLLGNKGTSAGSTKAIYDGVDAPPTASVCQKWRC